MRVVIRNITTTQRNRKNEYAIERVPSEVVDFAYYHFVKEKSEEEVRKELAKKGWTDKINQDEVFAAIGGFQSATELNRIK